jgi:hypothetical protein
MTFERCNVTFSTGENKMPALRTFFEDPIVRSKYSMARLVIFLFALTACIIALAIVGFAFKHDDKAMTIGTLGGILATLVTGGVIGVYGRSRAQSIDERVASSTPSPIQSPPLPPPPALIVPPPSGPVI